MKNTSSFRDALSKTLLEAGEEYKSMVLLTPDLTKSVRIAQFKEKYPDRFINTGISEADMISMAAGMATTGIIPVVAGFAMFVAERPFEQIRNSVAYPNLNVKIIATHGGISVGRDGATHQAIEDMAILRAVPNLTVLTAADAAETKAAILAALKHTGPVYLRLGRDESVDIYSEGKEFIIGGSDTLMQGDDVTIIACGIMVAYALEAAKALKKEGINASVINMYSIKPIDTGAIVSAAKSTKAIVAVEDHSVFGGLGSAVSEVLAKNCPIPMEQIGVLDTFGESGNQEELFNKYSMSTRDIIAAAKRVLERKADR